MGLIQDVELATAKVALGKLLQLYTVDVLLLAFRELIKEELKAGDVTLAKLAASLNAAYVDATRVKK